MLSIPTRLARDLIGDPVMAAEILFGAELDVYQKARLRLWWFTPTVVDHSGVATAKTETAIVFALLRLFLLPNPEGAMPRIVTHYFLRMGLAEEEYLPRFDLYVQKSNLLYRQIRLNHGRKIWQNLGGVLRCTFIGGQRLELPAGDFMKDSANQASKSFNDLIADEAGEIDKSSKGIDKQLNMRARLRCFNPFHPVWMNHKLYLGHAEDPGHPYHKRQRAIDRAVKSGSQDHGSFTACYKDYRGKFRQNYGEVAAKQAQDAKATLTDAEQKQQIYGLWAKGSKNWYGSKLVEDIERRDVVPVLARPEGEVGTLFALGTDSAPGMTSNADWNAFVVWAATRIARESIGRDTDLTGFYVAKSGIWFLRIVHAILLHGSNVDQRSGLIHRLHRAYHLDGIMMDPLGGGADVYKKLPENRQLIDNEWQEVRGICCRRDSFLYPQAEPLVAFFERGDPEMRSMLGDRYLKDNSGPVHFAHTELRAAMVKKRLAVPLPRARMSIALRNTLSVEQLESQVSIERVMGQFLNIGCKIDKDGSPAKSALGGYRQFTAGSRKKDGAMAALYGFVRMKMLLDGVRPDAAGGRGPSFGVFSS